MYYFVPAWYRPDQGFFTQHRALDEGQGQSQFDDTIHQLRVFQDLGREASVLILHYAPHLRSFLHRQGLDPRAYFSLFDELQGFPRGLVRYMSWQDFPWDPEDDFVYFHRKVEVCRSGRKKADIKINEEGRLLAICLYGDAEKKTYFFDDRGYLSCIERLPRGGTGQETAFVRSYYNPYGDLVMRESETGVAVYPACGLDLPRTSYASMEEVLSQALCLLFPQIWREQDELVVAASRQHNRLLASLPYDRTIYSVFYGRDNDLAATGQALCYIADNEEDRQAVLAAKPDSPVFLLPPYDTSFTLGYSQRTDKLEIAFLLDGLEPDQVQSVIQQFFDLMAKNDRIYLTCFSFLPYNDSSLLAQRLIQNYNENLALARAELEDMPGQMAKARDPQEDRASFQRIYQESELHSLLQWARLVCDFSPSPHVYTQIAAISAGIPQIHCRETYLVHHLENGYVIKKWSDIKTAVHYFIDSLRHWNQAVVHSFQQIDAYIGPHFDEKWQAAIEAAKLAQWQKTRGADLV